jgi:histidine triad (HIT) family protein
MKECIFCQIANKSIPSKIAFESPSVLVIEDLNPQAPIHLLVIPKTHLSGPLAIDDSHDSILANMFSAVREVAKLRKTLADDGFRTVINHGVFGGQTVFHIHMHLMGGRQMNWPPG